MGLDAFSILAELKYFPEVRELGVTTSSRAKDSVGDALTVLAYCPYLTHLTLRGKMGPTNEPPITGLSENSLKAIGTLTELQVLRLYDIDIGDDKLKHIAGMKNLLFLDLNHVNATSEIFPVIASLPRIRYVKLCGCDFDQPLNERAARALESLVGRLELFWTNEGDLEAAETRIHPSLETPITKIRAARNIASGRAPE
jgi:hypothetical protein